MNRDRNGDPVSAHEPTTLRQREFAPAEVEVFRPERSSPGMSLPLGEPEEETPYLDARGAVQQEFEPSRGEVRETFQETLGALE